MIIDEIEVLFDHKTSLPTFVSNFSIIIISEEVQVGIEPVYERNRYYKDLLNSIFVSIMVEVD